MSQNGSKFEPKNSRSNSRARPNETKLSPTFMKNLSRFKFDESSQESMRVAESEWEFLAKRERQFQLSSILVNSRSRLARALHLNCNALSQSESSNFSCILIFRYESGIMGMFRCLGSP